MKNLISITHEDYEESISRRGIYFIDPEDKEFKETIKNARKKLEIPVAPAMLCKIKQEHSKFWRDPW